MRRWIVGLDRPDPSAAPEVLSLPLDELLRAVDTAQLQDIVAHGGLHEHGEIASSGHRQHHLAHTHAEDLFGARLQRETVHAGHNAADGFFQLNDELEIFAYAHRRFPEDG